MSRHLSAEPERPTRESSPGDAPALKGAAAVVPWTDDSVGKVLVVDDDERNRRLLRDILEAQGHTVVLAEDGEQALAASTADCPDVVLLDVMMPNMDGFEVCRRLRQDTRTRHVPILIITALRDRTAMLTGIRSGANDFLTKPIDAEELRLRVRNAVSAKHLYDRVQEDYIRLTALQSLRDNLTDMIVHDIGSPLLAVSASFELLLNGDPPLTKQQHEFSALGQRSCAEVVAIVNSLLDVSRLEAGEMPLNREPCDLLKIATEASESVAALARQKALAIDINGEPATVDVDRDILHRVLVNLLVNAIKFSPKDAAITVRLFETATSVRVTVADRGPGIPPEHHQRIFEKFGHVESRKLGIKHSTGLGLTFCKLAMDAHGGQIGVASQAGTGSTFWIVIPRAGTADPMKV